MESHLLFIFFISDESSQCEPERLCELLPISRGRSVNDDIHNEREVCSVLLLCLGGMKHWEYYYYAMCMG